MTIMCITLLIQDLKKKFILITVEQFESCHYKVLSLDNASSALFNYKDHLSL